MSEEVNMNEDNGEQSGVFENINYFQYFSSIDMILYFVKVKECPFKTKHVLSIL